MTSAEAIMNLTGVLPPVAPLGGALAVTFWRTQPDSDDRRRRHHVWEPGMIQPAPVAPRPPRRHSGRRLGLTSAALLGFLLAGLTVVWVIGPARADSPPPVPCNLTEVREQAAERAGIARTGIRR